MRAVIIPVIFYAALAACSGNPPAPSPSSVGQWSTYGGNEPVVTNGVFNFPGSSGTAGYFYTKLPAAPGQTLTLNYDVTGNNPVRAQTPASGGNSQTDTNPPTITLFLWRNGEDLACGQSGNLTASYRMWTAKTELVLGPNQTVSAVLDPNVWTNCWGLHDPAGFLAALADELGLGFTFGGQSFDGHGIYLSSGTATFKINSFTVK